MWVNTNIKTLHVSTYIKYVCVNTQISCTEFVLLRITYMPLLSENGYGLIPIFVTHAKRVAISLLKIEICLQIQKG